MAFNYPGPQLTCRRLQQCPGWKHRTTLALPGKCVKRLRAVKTGVETVMFHQMELMHWVRASSLYHQIVTGMTHRRNLHFPSAAGPPKESPPAVETNRAKLLVAVLTVAQRSSSDRAGYDTLFVNICSPAFPGAVAFSHQHSATHWRGDNSTLRSATRSGVVKTHAVFTHCL